LFLVTARAATVFLLCWLVPAAWAQSNLLLNPSFESPAIGPASEQAGAPADWLSSGGIDYLISNGYSGNWAPASDGVQLAYLLSTGVPESLSQSGVELSGGLTYRFQVDLSKYALQPSGAITVTLNDGISTVSQSFATTSNGWTGEAWQLAAPESGDYTLAISAGVGTYPAIDNLSLTEYSAVPEPAAASWMIGCAVLAVAAQRARRSRPTWRGPSPTAAA
jgi:hypothetical protein